jgi:hypothetical protein
VKKPDVAIARFAPDRTAKFGGYRIALFTGAVPNTLGDGN